MHKKGKVRFHYTGIGNRASLDNTEEEIELTTEQIKSGDLRTCICMLVEKSEECCDECSMNEKVMTEAEAPINLSRISL